ncbi:esterase-like activity of phytase family protein [Nocardia sp. NPDC056000]|uniref:esterase-like activity of phytase family protein n=1 Tax=Nocardia sp. NPDC056000 TaxID=3345674 RepID=UPI0035E257B8
MSNLRLLAALCGALTLIPGTAAAETGQPTDAPIRLLGQQIVPFGLTFDGTTVGGLSGIDYRAATGEYVLISDDRSDVNPARFYTARFDVGATGIGPVTFTGTRPLLTATGSPYTPKSVDPEEIRVDPWSGDYWWTQEGERVDATLQDPSVRVARPDGAFVADMPIPENERMRPDSGPQRNLALEGASFAAAGSLFVTAMEGPLVQDDPAARQTRITVGTRFGQILAQYAYQLEPPFAESRPEPGQSMNGVASILAADPVDPAKFLVLERSFANGVGNRIRIYEADLGGATNVLNAPLTGARPASKRLLVDLDEVGLSAVDNIEGMTWGPRLPSGERTLILVSDNNFSDKQLTQLIALAVR